MQFCLHPHINTETAFSSCQWLSLESSPCYKSYVYFKRKTFNVKYFIGFVMPSFLFKTWTTILFLMVTRNEKAVNFTWGKNISLRCPISEMYAKCCNQCKFCSPKNISANGKWWSLKYNMLDDSYWPFMILTSLLFFILFDFILIILEYFMKWI